MFTAVSAFSGLATSDLDQMKTFYTTVLGLALKDDSMGLVFELPGGGELFVYDRPDYQPPTHTVLNFVVADIDQAVDELTQDGVSFERYEGMPGGQDEKGIMRGRATNDGPDIAWFKDPSGNILAVLQN